jgi:hypothetical protein
MVITIAIMIMITILMTKMMTVSLNSSDHDNDRHKAQYGWYDQLCDDITVILLHTDNLNNTETKVAPATITTRRPHLLLLVPNATTTRNTTSISRKTYTAIGCCSGLRQE